MGVGVGTGSPCRLPQTRLHFGARHGSLLPGAVQVADLQFPCLIMHTHIACPDAVLAPAYHLFNMLPCPKVGKICVGQIFAYPTLNLQEP